MQQNKEKKDIPLPWLLDCDLDCARGKHNFGLESSELRSNLKGPRQCGNCGAFEHPIQAIGIEQNEMENDSLPDQDRPRISLIPK